MKNKQTFKWTISIIAQVDKTVTWEFNDLLKNISDQKECSHIRYVIFYYNQNTHEAYVKKREWKNEKQSIRAKNALRTVTNSRKQHVSLFNKKTLIDFFNNYVLDKESENHMLITWGHGVGLGFFYDPLMKKNKFKKNRTSQKAQNTKKLLSAEDFADTLKQSFGRKQKKIKVHIALNCWVNMFETGWALKDVVEIYAASQIVLPFAGIHYTRLFKALQNKPSLSEKELAQNITDNFPAKYTDRSAFAKYFTKYRPWLDVRECSMSVNYLPGYEEIGEIINELSLYLIHKLKSNRDKKNFLSKIDSARNCCTDLSMQGAFYVDFTHFFSELMKSFHRKEVSKLKELYYKFACLKDKTLLSIMNPGILFKFHPKFLCSQSPQMFSIFFPIRMGRSAKQNKFIRDEYFNKPLEFHAECKWVEFLKTYISTK